MTVRVKQTDEVRCDCGVTLEFSKEDIFRSIAPKSRFGPNYEFPAILCPKCKAACCVGLKP